MSDIDIRIAFTRGRLLYVRDVERKDADLVAEVLGNDLPLVQRMRFRVTEIEDIERGLKEVERDAAKVT